MDQKSKWIFRVKDGIRAKIFEKGEDIVKYGENTQERVEKESRSSEDMAKIRKISSRVVEDSARLKEDIVKMERR